MFSRRAPYCILISTGHLIWPLHTPLRYLKLLLIRHAESIGNTQRRMEGQQSTPLSSLGQQQAQHLSQALIESSLSAAQQVLAPNPLRVAKTLPTHVYSSPLLRATQTATALEQTLQKNSHPISIQQAVELREMHPGIFQGLTWAEAIALYPDLCDRLMTSLEWQPVPQAESPSEARARAQAWVDQLLKNHTPGDTIWAVSHAGLMLHIIAVIMGMRSHLESHHSTHGHFRILACKHPLAGPRARSI